MKGFIAYLYRLNILRIYVYAIYVLVATDPPDIIVRMENNDPSVTLPEILKSDEAKSM